MPSADFMQIAREIAKASKCDKRKVGAVITKYGRIISTGYNGTPTGFSNTCEDDSVTKDTVIHAEMNAILATTKLGISLDDATLVVTYPPCIDCAKHILQTGISTIVYDLKDIRPDKKLEGVSMLFRAGKKLVVD